VYVGSNLGGFQWCPIGSLSSFFSSLVSGFGILMCWSCIRLSNSRSWESRWIPVAPWKASASVPLGGGSRNQARSLASSDDPGDGSEGGFLPLV
jgi:hypothetical protein